MKKILYILACTLFLAACTDADNSASKTTGKPSLPANEAGWKQLSNVNYEIVYPDRWELFERMEKENRFLIMTPSESDTDHFREYVSLSINYATVNNVTPAAYADTIKASVKHSVANAVIISGEKGELSGKPCYRLVYSGDQATHHLMYEAVIWTSGNAVYTLTYTAEAPSYQRFKPEVEKMFNAFKIK